MTLILDWVFKVKENINPPHRQQNPNVQVLESQSAMSILMMQVARQRSQQLLQHQQQPQHGVPKPTPQTFQAAGHPIGQAGPGREMRMDEK